MKEYRNLFKIAMAKPLYTRPALLESIATVHALANTANSNSEYLHWAAREYDLRTQAGTITEAEEATINKIAQTKVDEYNTEVSR